MTEQEQKRKAYYQLPISPPYCSLCPDTPFSLAAWGHHQELHLTSSAALTAHRSPTLQLLEFPSTLVRQLHLLWQFWLNCLQYILEKVQIEFSEACSLNLSFTLNMRLHSPLLVSIFFFFLINLKVVILLEIQVVCYKAVSNDTVSEFRCCRILILTMQITDNSSEGKGTCL